MTETTGKTLQQGGPVSEEVLEASAGRAHKNMSSQNAADESESRLGWEEDVATVTGKNEGAGAELRHDSPELPFGCTDPQ